jgi:hypothetical protein
MDSDIPIDPALLPRATTTPLPQTAATDTQLTVAVLPPALTFRSPTRLAGSLIIPPQRDEQGRFTLSGYTFHESL